MWLVRRPRSSETFSRTSERSRKLANSVQDFARSMPNTELSLLFTLGGLFRNLSLYGFFSNCAEEFPRTPKDSRATWSCTTAPPTLKVATPWYSGPLVVG